MMMIWCTKTFWWNVLFRIKWDNTKTLNDFMLKKVMYFRKITMFYILKQMTDEDIELLSKNWWWNKLSSD